MSVAIDRDGGAQGVPVPGLLNLREAPGARGLLFRSESLARLDAAGAAALVALGVDLVLDLRSEAETTAEPYGHDGIRRLALPIALLEPGEALDAELTLEALYGRLLDQYGPTLVAAVRAIAHHEGGAVLVHCTAGKDRTGVVVALAALLLGAERHTVLADYAATHDNLRGAWTEAFLARAGIDALPENLLEVLNGSPAPLLDRLLERLDAEHGGAEGYLRAHELDDGDLAALRARHFTASASA